MRAAADVVAHPASAAHRRDSPSPSQRPKPARRVAARLSAPPHPVLSGLVVLLVFALQLLAPRLPHEIVRFLTTKQHWHVTSPAAPSGPSALLKQPPVCPRPSHSVEFAGTFYTDTERSMALAEQARRVAAEFDFGPDAVNKAVREFIREMGTPPTHTRCGRDADAARRGAAAAGHRAQPDPHIRHRGAQRD